MGDPRIASAAQANPLPEELEAVELPELGGLKVGFAMCLNRMCPNFGAYWGTEPGSDGTTDSRYEFGERSKDSVRGKTLIC